MPIEGQAKFFSPENKAGFSLEKGIAVIPQTIAANGDCYDPSKDQPYSKYRTNIR